MIVLWLLAAAVSPVAKPVVDPELCRLRVETRLTEQRNLHNPSEENWDEVFLLDAGYGGDEQLAVSFMAQHGWIAWANDHGDKQIPFVVNKTNLGRSVPIGHVSDGPELACKASWISGVPFISVSHRSKGPFDLAYEVKAE